MFAKKYFAAILLAVVCASSVAAAPYNPTIKHTTHRRHELNERLNLEAFHPESTYETYNEGLDHPLLKRASESLEDAALSFVQSKLGVKADAITYKSGYAGEVSKHAYVKQTISGIPVANAVANIAFNHQDKVVAFGSSFVKPAKIPSSTPLLSVEDAVAKAEASLGGKYNEWPATLEWVAKEDGSIVLTRVVQIQNENSGMWVEAFVDAHSGEIVHITDFVARASYRVLPIQKELPTDGFEILTDPQDTIASPDGWHSTDGTTTTTNTSGNNVISYKSSTSGISSETSDLDNFDYTWNSAVAPTTSPNIDVARVNAFYVVNTVHDISYKYGFTEAAYNFQQNNFGKGGSANDRVTVSVQDSAGTNNADFSTPADGQSGHMRMFLWTYTSPQRDGALENDIIVHENTHGITNRLTGGGTGRCLQTTEAGGMGEGWSDAFAEWTEQKSATITDFVLGSYVINSSKGIRHYPYSTSTTTNPLRYSSLQTLTEVHYIGEVWANTLHNVYAALVGKYGFDINAKTDPTSTAGNAVYLHLFIDALALQPCNPTLLTARDAWIQADANRYGGANKCLIWQQFASRGLGVNAQNHVDDSTVPSGC